MPSTALATRPRRPLTSTLSAPFRAIGQGFKSATSLVFAGGRRSWGYTWGLGWRNPRTDYAKAVGDGLSSSILVACLNAIADPFPEPPLRVYRQRRDGQRDIVAGHALSKLLRRPNPYMPWELLAKCIVWSQHLTGNAYFYKVRSGTGRVVELWPINPNHLEPKWPEGPDNQVWISHYEYTPNGKPLILSVEDVLHLPLNIDPDNPRKGRSPLTPLFAELFTDQEAAAFTAALLKNMGVPGVILTPDPSAEGGPNEEQSEHIKELYKAKFGGDNRGEPMVIPGPMKVEVVSFSPEQLSLEKVRLLSETRVCAVLGVPAIVAHLKAGMDAATYNNTGGLREHFTESKLVPYWRLIESLFTLHLLPEFDAGEEVECKFDLSDVRAIQIDEDAKYARLEKMLLAGAVTINEVRSDIGLNTLPNGDVFLLPGKNVPQKAADLGQPLIQLPRDGDGDGNVDEGGSTRRARIREVAKDEDEKRKALPSPV